MVVTGSQVDHDVEKAVAGPRLFREMVAPQEGTEVVHGALDLLNTAAVDAPKVRDMAVGWRDLCIRRERNGPGVVS